MSAWSELLHKASIAILIIMLLLLTSPSSLNARKMPQKQLRRTRHKPHKEAASWKRISGGTKVDIHRLYDAYREKLKETSDNTKYHADLVSDISAVNEENIAEKNAENDADISMADVKAKLMAVDKELRKKSKYIKNLVYTPIRLDEYKDRKAKILTMQKDNVGHIGGKKKNNKDSTVAIQIDKDKAKSIQSEETQDVMPEVHKSDTANPLEKLNQDYQQLLSVWKKPLLDNERHNNFFPKVLPAEDDSYRPCRLSALNELMNVIENIRQTNALEDMVKAINDGMNQETPTTAGTDALKESSAEKFKRVQRAQANQGNPTKSDQSGNRNSCLYDVYKRKLNEILTTSKNQSIQSSASTGKDKSTSKEAINNPNTLVQCHCGERKIMQGPSVEGQLSNELTQCHCEATKISNQPIHGDATKISNTLTQCHCGAPKGVKMVVDNKKPENKDYLKAQLEKETKLNGGLKPYYLSNSKQRQMVWNEVPLIRPGTAQPVDKSSTEQIPANKSPISIKNINIQCELKTKNIVDQPVQNGNTNKKLDPANKNQKQLEHLLKVFESKHRASALRKSVKRGLLGIDTVGSSANNLAFPEVLVNQIVPTQHQTGGKMIEGMARQLNVSPVEMAQRIATSSGTAGAQLLVPGTYSNYPGNLASQTPGSRTPAPTVNVKCTPDLATGQQSSANLGSVLDMILQRLQTIQDMNENSANGHGDKLPCCFAEPTDGAPCDLTGSWESVLLGIRINIRDESINSEQEKQKPPCAQPPSRPPNSIRYRRTCAKVTSAQIRKNSQTKTEFGLLNITIQETTPPRPHELLENLAEWSFTGHALSTLGGPILMTCRNMNSRLIGTFVGYCRTCGCMDTIFGSWSFCLPSRDCQDITMSFFERRDILRRYTLDSARKEHFKNNLYKQSTYAKAEKNRLQTLVQSEKISSI